MAEFDRGSALPSTSNSGTVSSPYVMHTPTVPAGVFVVAAGLLATAYVGISFLPAGASGMPLPVDVAAFLFVLLLPLVGLIYSCGPSGRFAKRVTVDHKGVTITPLLARLNPSLSTHLPAAGLWCLTPDDCVGPLPERDSNQPETWALTRWVLGERRPPDQARVLVGHDNPDLRWHSLKTTRPQELVDAVVAVAVDAGTGAGTQTGTQIGTEARSLNRLTTLEQSSVTAADTEVDVALSQLRFFGVKLWWFSILAVAITVALQHPGWDGVMLIAATVPYAARFTVELLSGMLSDHADPKPTGRLAGFVVGNTYSSARRQLASYRPTVRLVGSDNRFVDLEKVWGRSRCPVPLGSPVSVLAFWEPPGGDDESGSLRYEVDVHDQGAALGVLLFLPLCVLFPLIWVLWVADALVGLG